MKFNTSNILPKITNQQEHCSKHTKYQSGYLCYYYLKNLLLSEELTLITIFILQRYPFKIENLQQSTTTNGTRIAHLSKGYQNIAILQATPLPLLSMSNSSDAACTSTFAGLQTVTATLFSRNDRLHIRTVRGGRDWVREGRTIPADQI